MVSAARRWSLIKGEYTAWVNGGRATGGPRFIAHLEDRGAVRDGMSGRVDQQEVCVEGLGDSITEVDKRLIGCPGLELPAPGQSGD